MSKTPEGWLGQRDLTEEKEEFHMNRIAVPLGKKKKRSGIQTSYWLEFAVAVNGRVAGMYRR